MSRFTPQWQAVLAILLCLAADWLGAMSAPEAAALADPTISMDYPYLGTRSLIFDLLFIAALVSMIKLPVLVRIVVLFIAVHWAAWLLVGGIYGFEGTALAPYFLTLAAAWLLAWLCVSLLSSLNPLDRSSRWLLRLVIPVIFGTWILILWEGITRGAGVPFVLLPPPSLIGLRFGNSLPILAADVQQTVFKAVIVGYALGCSLGFLTAILADRVSFLRRGLLPIGNMVSALPIIAWRRSW
jgi:NitT/TauT family transport system permease protein